MEQALVVVELLILAVVLIWVNRRLTRLEQAHNRLVSDPAFLEAIDVFAEVASLKRLENALKANGVAVPADPAVSRGTSKPQTSLQVDGKPVGTPR